MKIYLATGNKNKKREMSEILSEHTIVTPSDEGIDFNPIENGTSFFENSLIKAKALFEIVKCPVIADDSGICVDALNGRPGIFSARYAGPDYPEGMPDSSKIPQEKQNEFLINQLNDELKNTKNRIKKYYLSISDYHAKEIIDNFKEINEEVVYRCIDAPILCIAQYISQYFSIFNKMNYEITNYVRFDKYEKTDIIDKRQFYYEYCT